MSEMIDRIAGFIHYPGVLVLSGPPGCGKSFVADWLDDHYDRGMNRVAVVSADHFFEPDYSDFSPALLPEAHRECFRRFLVATQLERRSLVIVDNTNTRAAEAAPYILAGEALGYKVRVMRIYATLDMCLARQTHGVPEEILSNLYSAWAARDVMPWWDVVEVDQEGRLRDHVG